MATSKQELFADDLDNVTGGAGNKNTNTNNTVDGTNNKSIQEGHTNNMNNSTVHMGNSISQVSDVKNNSGNVKIDKPVVIENAGSGNTYNL